MTPPGGSDEEDDRQQRFQVLPGGRGGGGPQPGDGLEVEIVEEPPGRRPFPVDAMVVEEDTWKVLSAPPPVLPASEHPIRVMNRAWEAEPETLATVQVEPGPPLRFVAIVYDLDADPVCVPETVARVLEEILDLVEEHRVEALALPPLGVAHGRFPRERFDELLDEALRRATPPSLRRLWILRPDARPG